VPWLALLAMAWGLDASWILGSDIFFLKDANNQDLHGA
jgi:hypothetical protein